MTERIFRQKESEPITDNHYNIFEKYCKGFAPILVVWYNYESFKGAKCPKVKKVCKCAKVVKCT